MRPSGVKLILAVVALALTACSVAPAAAPPRPTPAPGHAPSAAPTLRDVVRDPHAILIGLRVRGGAAGALDVTSAWALGRRRAIAHSDDGFASASYSTWTRRADQRLFGSPRVDPSPAGLDGLMTAAAPAIGTSGPGAVVGGGDGATLLPFQRVARTAGGSWRTYAVTGFGGRMPYTDGSVVLPDGRLLTLLDHWSDDHGRRPGALHHGLWVSDGSNWAAYTPFRPRLVPAPAPPPGVFQAVLAELGGTAGPRGLMWVETWDGGVYVSRDGASFRAIPVR